MKKIIALCGLIILLLSGCGSQVQTADIAATTLPVYEFTMRLCQGTGLTVTRLVTESVSCLHDYSLNVNQVRAAEAADVIVLSGAGLEDFMADILEGKQTVDASTGIVLLESCHDHDHGQEDDHGHAHEKDPHIWLAPGNAKAMAANICAGLCAQYPQHQATIESNLSALLTDIDGLQAYADQQLSQLSNTQIITFHDGFSYLADAWDLTIVEAIEEESGSEASAAELQHIIGLVKQHQLTALFTEANGSASAASDIAAETGAAIYTLDMAMSGDSWFDAMYHNIDTLREALQ